MGTFQTRRIRQRPPLEVFRKGKDAALRFAKALAQAGAQKKHYVLAGALAFLGVVIVIKVTLGLVGWVRNFDVANLASGVAADLIQDQNGYTNIVLLGDGGHERDGADLVDSIIVASIDFQNGSVAMLSIPRDYYFRDPQLGKCKINELYRKHKREMGDAAYGVFAKAAEELMGLEVPYYARVDFNAFVEVVDSLGGITVDVREPIYDPYYPNETDDGYTVFEMKAGPQEMNGEAALKFTRSRKTTSDFDRAFRQQQVLMAIKDKAMSAEILTNPKTLKRLYDSVQNNLNTNLSFREMLALGALAKNIDREHILMKVLHDDPTREGGFLYTPERQYYNGQFVLIPIGDSMDQIQKYTSLVFGYRDFFMEGAKIEVLNATKEPGIARSRAETLRRYGFNIVNIDNLLDKEGQRKNVERSFVRYNSWEVDKEGNIIPRLKATLAALEDFAKGEALPGDEPQTVGQADISVVIGQDAVE